MNGRDTGSGGGGGGGADSRRSSRDANRSDWVRRRPVASSAAVLQASRLVNLSRAYDINDSKPLNFFASSSMEVVI